MEPFLAKETMNCSFTCFQLPVIGMEGATSCHSNAGLKEQAHSPIRNYNFNHCLCQPHPSPKMAPTANENTKLAAACDLLRTLASRKGDDASELAETAILYTAAGLIEEVISK